MSAEIAKLKAELEALNLQCQLARDHEIRHALQRTRLETARMQLILKIVDAIASSAGDISAAPIKPMVKARPDAIRTVTIPAKPVRMSAVKHRRKRKPSGLPTLTNMILAVLENGADETPDGMRPRDIANTIRKMWWPDIRTRVVGAAVWKLAGKGRLEKSGSFYKLNGHAEHS
jgi:hypothetical protein